MISRDDVIWAYRMLLGREPESPEVVEHHARVAAPPTRDGMRRMIARSGEFSAAMGRLGLRVIDETETEDLIAPHLDLSDQPGEPGFFRDRFGVRTRCAFLPASYDAYSGGVASDRNDPGMPLHDLAELRALLLAVGEAEGRLTVMELGAGWGPWLVLAARCAARRGLACRLIGVEASADHVAFMRAHFSDNGVDAEDHQIIHAAVGARDGVARFPKLADARADWGAQADFAAAAVAPATEMEEVASVSLGGLLDRTGRVDLLHCDIQGAEAEAMASAIGQLTRAVRRVVIGTHGRAIEARLLDLFSGHGWRLEHDQACVMSARGGGVALLADGVQAWRNDSCEQLG